MHVFSYPDSELQKLQERTCCIFIASQIGPLLQKTQKFITSGATEHSSGIVVTKSTGLTQSSDFDSNADESDTRIWLHIKHSIGPILSPDTDVYHIGLPMISASEKLIHSSA